MSKLISILLLSTFVVSCSVVPSVPPHELAMDYAVKGDVESLGALLKKSPELVKHTFKKDRERNLLHFAGSRAVAELLVNAGADVTSKDRFGWTPLHTASSREVAEYLIANKADVNAKAQKGLTPLHTVESAGAAEALVKSGADLNSGKDSHHKLTPLYWQIQQAHVAVVEVLIKSGADVKIKKRGGQTLLHFAAERTGTEVLAMLVKKGISVNVTDDHGATPLHIAALKDYPDNVAELLRLGANPRLKLKPNTAVYDMNGSEVDAGNKTALEIAASDRVKALLTGK